MSYKTNSLISSDKVVVSYEKKLSICLGVNGFSFSVTTVRDELLAIGDVQCNLAATMSELMADIKAVLAEANVQPYGLKESELIVNSRLFTWIPQHLFDDTKQRNYLDALGTVSMGCGVFSDFNDTVKAHLVFSAENNIVSAFKIAIPGLKVRCLHGKIVGETLADASNMKSLLLIHIREGVCDFEVLCNKKLQLSNSFDCVNFDETMYHALNLTKQFRLDDVPMTVAMCGMVDREQFDIVRRYFPEVVLYTGRRLILTMPEMQRVPLYRHAAMLS